MHKLILKILIILLSTGTLVSCGSVYNLGMGYDDHLYRNYDPDVYGGVKHDLDYAKDLYRMESVGLTLILGPVLLIETGMSFAVDTATLPYTIPYDISQEIHEEEHFFEKKEYVPGVGEQVRLKHKEGPSILAVDENVWGKLNKALATDDRSEVKTLIQKEEAYRIHEDKKVKILQVHFFRYKVKIIEGPHEGLTGWVSSKLIEGE